MTRISKFKIAGIAITTLGIGILASYKLFQPFSASSVECVVENESSCPESLQTTFEGMWTKSSTVQTYLGSISSLSQKQLFPYRIVSVNKKGNVVVITIKRVKMISRIQTPSYLGCVTEFGVIGVLDDFSTCENVTIELEYTADISGELLSPDLVQFLTAIHQNIELFDSSADQVAHFKIESFFELRYLGLPEVVFSIENPDQQLAEFRSLQKSQTPLSSVKEIDLRFGSPILRYDE